MARTTSARRWGTVEVRFTGDLCDRVGRTCDGVVAPCGLDEDCVPDEETGGSICAAR